MITGISLLETEDFVSIFDKGDPKTVWKISVLNADIFSYVGSKADKSMDALIEVVRFGLKGFENFKDKFGNDIKFDTVNKSLGGVDYKIVDPHIVNMIPVDVVTELGGRILRNSKLQPDESKN